MIEPYFNADGTTIFRGDCLDVLRRLPDGVVQTCVTSPPYWGLRDYGVVGQLGLEHSPDCLGWATGRPCGECYVCRLVAVLREVRRVLRRDGTLWLNLGHTYAGYWGKKYAHRPFGKDRTADASTPPNKPSLDFSHSAIKPKDLIGIPWRVALALQADGWYLRSDVIWAKTNPSPESVCDRPTCSHEYLFLLSRSRRYYFDRAAIAEPCLSGPSDLKKMREKKYHIGGKHLLLHDPRNKGNCHTQMGKRRAVGSPAGRNKRSVWAIATKPFSARTSPSFRVNSWSLASWRRPAPPGAVRFVAPISTDYTAAGWRLPVYGLGAGLHLHPVGARSVCSARSVPGERDHRGRGAASRSPLDRHRTEQRLLSIGG